MEKIGVLDATVFIAYFVIVVLIGFYMGRKKKESARDYFVTTGRLPWYLIGFAMVASSISTEQFIGSAGEAYQWGIVIFNWEWCNWPAMLILLWIFLPVYLNKKIITMPGYLEKRFGEGPRNIYAIITILAALFIILPGVIYTGGYLLEQIFGLNRYVGIWLMAIVAGTFTIYGGMISVAWAQMFQAILLLASGVLVFFLAVNRIDGGLSAILFPAGDPSRHHLMLPASHPELPWTSIIVLAFSTNIWYFCTSQYIIQSTLGARSRWDGKMGIIFLGFLMLLTGISVEFPGLIAYALDPAGTQITEVDQAYPFVVKTLVTTGLKGLVLAGLCGAVMSTIEALVHSSSTVFTMDLYCRLRKNVSDEHMIKVGRFTTASLLLASTILAPIVRNFESIFDFFQKCWFFIAAPIAAVFILAVLWKRTTKAAAFWTLMLALPLFLVPHGLQIAERRLDWQVNEYNLAGVMLLISMAFAIVTSLLTRPPKPEQIEGLVWRPSMIKLPEAELALGYPWYKNLWLWCAVWVGVMLAIYINLW